MFLRTMMQTFEIMGENFLEEVKQREPEWEDFEVDLDIHDKIKVKFIIEKMGRTTMKKLLKEKVEKIKKEIKNKKEVDFKELPDDINEIISNYKKQIEIKKLQFKINVHFVEFYGEYLLDDNATFGEMEDIAGCCGSKIMLEKLYESLHKKSTLDINNDEELKEKKSRLVKSAYFLNRDR